MEVLLSLITGLLISYSLFTFHTLQLTFGPLKFRNKKEIEMFSCFELSAEVKVVDFEGKSDEEKVFRCFDQDEI